MTDFRIDLLSPPFKGHLHPMLAMGRMLAGHGYRVRVISSAAARTDIETAGLEALILSGINEQQLSEVINPPRAIGHSPFKLAAQFAAVLNFLSHISVQLEQIYRCDPVDLIIADFTLPPAGIIADRLGIRWWTSLPSPCVLECGDGPPAYLGGWLLARTPAGKLVNMLGRKLIRVFKRTLFLLYRKPIRALGLQQVYREDGSEAIYSAETILCLGEQQLEFAQRWPIAAAFIGPMLYTPGVSDMPEPEFRMARHYILVTLGTHLNHHKEILWQAVNKIAAEYPEFVFHFSNGGLSTDSVTSAPNCQRYDYINYQHFIDRYSLVIHHGGAGIMYHCLRQQIPAIVFPHDYDQFDHAARLSQHGLAIWLRSIDELNAAIQQALDPAIRDRLKGFSDTMDEPSERLLTLIRNALTDVPQSAAE